LEIPQLRRDFHFCHPATTGYLSDPNPRRRRTLKIKKKNSAEASGDAVIVMRSQAAVSEQRATG
jgi:hypothetical protein